MWFGKDGNEFDVSNAAGLIALTAKSGDDYQAVFFQPETARKIAAELIRLADEIEGVN